MPLKGFYIQYSDRWASILDLQFSHRRSGGSRCASARTSPAQLGTTRISTSLQEEFRSSHRAIETEAPTEGARANHLRSQELIRIAGLGDLKGIEALLHGGAVATQATRLEIARTLVERSSGFDTPDAQGCTILMRAIAGNHRHLVTLLSGAISDLGGDLNAVAPAGSAMSWAVAYNRMSMMEDLLSAGATVDVTQLKNLALANFGVVDLEGRNTTGATLLMNAALQGYRQLTAALLGAGANVSAESAYGFTALDLAITGDHADVVHDLWNSNAQLGQTHGHETVMGVAAKFGCLEVIQALLDVGFGVNDVNANGESALMKSVEFGQWDAVELLLCSGADVNLPSLKGVTPLMLAVSTRQWNIAKSLMDAGANISAARWLGAQALLLAYEFNDGPMYQRLIGIGIGLNLKSGDGNLMASVAAKRGDLKVINDLIGYDVILPDDTLLEALNASRGQHSRVEWHEVNQDLVDQLRLQGVPLFANALENCGSWALSNLLFHMDRI